jgi:hypothetical protein
MLSDASQQFKLAVKAPCCGRCRLLKTVRRTMRKEVLKGVVVQRVNFAAAVLLLQVYDFILPTA